MKQLFIEYLKLALREDLEPLGDITSSALIPADSTNVFFVKARRQSGVMSGFDHVKQVYNLIDPEIEIEELVKAGQTFAPAGKLLKITGRTLSILQGERIFLNLLQRAISIATHTNMFVQLIAGTHTKILDTRKTIPCLRSLEKQAVRDGGGLNHRFNLSTGMMIKDNHISASKSIREAVLNGLKQLPYLNKLEVEVDSIEQLKEILDLPIDLILLDNFAIPLLDEAVSLVNQSQKSRKHPLLLEASGGVNVSSVRQIAEIGLDFISVGSLTQSPPIIDIGLDSLDLA